MDNRDRAIPHIIIIVIYFYLCVFFLNVLLLSLSDYGLFMCDWVLVSFLMAVQFFSLSRSLSLFATVILHLPMHRAVVCFYSLLFYSCCAWCRFDTLFVYLLLLLLLFLFLFMSLLLLPLPLPLLLNMIIII